MTLAGTGVVLGPLLSTASGSLDAAGISAWLSIANKIVSWIPANNTVSSAGCVAASGLVSNGGTLSFSATTPTFGAQLAAQLGIVDAAGIAKWTAVGAAILSWINTNGQVNATALVANPITGAVTGVATIAMTNVAAGPSLAAAAGSTDAPGIAGWTLIGAAMMNHIKATAVIAPIAWTSPPGGGPVLGVSVIT